MSRRWLALGSAVWLAAMVRLPADIAAKTVGSAPTPTGPYARIAIMRAVDGHAVEWEEGYIRHLEWHRQVKDPFGWYSYSVWASTDRQRWILYATFGHTAGELSNPVSPAEDERDNLINVLPHAQFLGNWIYEFVPALSRGNGVPTPMPRSEYMTVDVHLGAGKRFEEAIGAERSTRHGETLWFRLVLGGAMPRYVRLRPRASLAVILDERADQALPDTVKDLIASVTVETLNLRPNMLVNVTPWAAR